MLCFFQLNLGLQKSEVSNSNSTIPVTKCHLLSQQILSDPIVFKEKNRPPESSPPLQDDPFQPQWMMPKRISWTPDPARAKVLCCHRPNCPKHDMFARPPIDTQPRMSTRPVNELANEQALPRQALPPASKAADAWTCNGLVPPMILQEWPWMPGTFEIDEQLSDLICFCAKLMCCLHLSLRKCSKRCFSLQC